MTSSQMQMGHREVSILANISIPETQIPIKTKLHAVAIRISLSKIITLCSVYFPLTKTLVLKI